MMAAMDEDGFGAELDGVRRQLAHSRQAAEDADRFADASRAEFANFAAWVTGRARAAGWEPRGLPVTEARTRRGPLTRHDQTEFVTAEHPSIHGLVVTEAHPTLAPVEGQSWLVTEQGQVYRYFDDGWFEEGQGEIAALSGVEEIAVKSRLRSVLLTCLATHEETTS